MARMNRIWSERKSADVETRRQRIDRLATSVVADFAETLDGDSVLRIETRIVHRVGNPETQQLVDCDGCERCGGLAFHDVIVDPSFRGGRNDAVRMAIRHADGLFERWRTGVEDWTQPDRAVRPVAPLQGA